MKKRFSSPSFRLISLAACVLLLTCSSILQGQTQQRAADFVLYRATSSEAASYWKIAVFLSRNPIGPWIEFDVGQTKPLRLETSQVVKEVSFVAALNSNIATDHDLMVQEKLLADLADIAKNSPNTAKTISIIIKLIEENIQKFKGGLVRHLGTWMSYADYQEKLKQSEMHEQDILDRRKNLKTDYMPIVCRPLLADYDSFTAEVGRLSNLSISVKNTNVFSSSGSFETRLGKLDPGLKERSKPLPASSSLNMSAGIYPSAFQDGPAVLWSAKGDNLIAVDIGVTIRWTQNNFEIVNQNELEQVKFFLKRFDESLFETVIDAIAASKIKAVLTPPRGSESLPRLERRTYSTNSTEVSSTNPLKLLGRFKLDKDEFTVLQKTTALFKSVILVGKPTALPDDTLRQLVMVRLR